MHGGSAGTIIPKCSFLLGLAVYTFSLSQPGHGESDANACCGVDFDTKRPLVASCGGSMMTFTGLYRRN
jgi:hypothetical protein